MQLEAGETRLNRVSGELPLIIPVRQARAHHVWRARAIGLRTSTDRQRWCVWNRGSGWGREIAANLRCPVAPRTHVGRGARRPAVRAASSFANRSGRELVLRGIGTGIREGGRA